MATKKKGGAKVNAEEAFEYPDGSGIRIAFRKNKVNGTVSGTSYRVRIPSDLTGMAGKRETKQFRTMDKAKRYAEDRLVALRKYGTTFADIPAEAQKEAIAAWAKLAPHGIGFMEAVECALKHLRPAGGIKTLSEVLQELRASKKQRFEQGLLSRPAEADFRKRSLKIERDLGTLPTGQITPDRVRKWLEKIRNEGVERLDSEGNRKVQALRPRSVLNYRNTLAEALRHAEARQYVSENPMDRFTKEDYKALGGAGSGSNTDGIGFLTVEEAEKLLRTAQARPELGLLPSLVIRLFCGLRTEETCRLEWSEVHWTQENPYVHITKEKAKKRRIRHVTIPANALAWLALCNPPKEGFVVPQNWKTNGLCKRMRRLAKMAGIQPMDNNATRHSFGSYHYALYSDSALTSAQLGHKNNDTQLFDHYRHLVSKADAEKYFGIVPIAAGSNSIPFPQAAQG